MSPGLPLSRGSHRHCHRRICMRRSSGVSWPHQAQKESLRLLLCPLPLACRLTPRVGQQQALWPFSRHHAFHFSQVHVQLQQRAPEAAGPPPSRSVVPVLPRSKRLLIPWLQSPSAVILGPKKMKSVTVSTVSASISHEVMGLDA